MTLLTLLKNYQSENLKKTPTFIISYLYCEGSKEKNMRLTKETMLNFIKECRPLETEEELQEMTLDELAELYDDYRIARCQDEFDMRYNEYI